LKGQLLIAQPLLNDGFFNRSVVYLTNHNDEGSLGFIINFKTHFKLRDIRPQIKNGNFEIFEGGPVGKNQLFFLHTLGDAVPESIEIQNGVFFGGDFQELLFLIEHNKVRPHEIKFFSGYCGWGVMQLQKEIENKNWFILNHGAEEIFEREPSQMWRNNLRTIKPSYGIFADVGCDPGLN
jgi:putative transcriptional regulator